MFVTVYLCMCMGCNCVYICIELAVNLQQKNTDHFTKAIYERPKGTPLITVSNHLSCIDDPLIWGEPQVTYSNDVVWYDCFRCGTDSTQFFKSYEMVSIIIVLLLQYYACWP